MERPKAMRLAGASTAACLALTVVAGHRFGFLGLGPGLAPVQEVALDPAAPAHDGPSADPKASAQVTTTFVPETVIVTELIYADEYVVVTTTPPTTAPALPPTTAPVATTAATLPPTTAPAGTGTTTPTTAGTTSTTTPRASTSTTRGGTSTSTSLPAGFEVPGDWPAGVPYPPIPPGCVRGHLEDNGHWNCER